MKNKELREKTIEELNKVLNEERSKMSQIRFDIKARQVKNYRKIRSMKKDIARIITLIKEKNSYSKVIKK